MRGNVKVYQKRIVARKRKRLLFMFLWNLLFVGVGFGILSFISQLDVLAVQEVKVEGASRLSPAAITAIAEDRLAGNYLAFFSKRNKLLYPKDAIQEAVAALPAVKSAIVESDGWNAILVRIAERGKAAVWCAGPEKDESDCYSADENGYLFAPAEGRSGMVYRGLLDGAPLGNSIMAADRFRSTQFFVREIENLGLAPQEVDMGQAGYLSLLLAGGGKLVVNASDDLSVVLSNIASIFADRSLVPDKEAFLSKLDYIRLDAGNKVFYKMR